ncbi:HAT DIMERIZATION DOMAIN-CONTAINING PROTEIN ISOFORM 1 [Salix koriyanagi]|uniref:HAT DIMERIZATION DOMAIN-CONTAINING PROTEIN ISOFORM 1 n=1 Tax=Salix koriyanagi TaxID=2511006 RepID=A0A9Q0U4D3_9ROSI|nr:HAT DIMERIZATION DOMAIN-CONTAINING PROTEIN ISOFORM 1 [Salix koriyanagi]
MAPLRSSGYIDPGWEHGIAQDERKKKVKCNYCGKIVSGGIFRLKQHLARMSGEVTHCVKVPEEVCFNMRKNLEGCRSGRKRRQTEYEQASLAFHSNEYDDMEEASCSYKQKGKRVVGDKNLVIRFASLRSLGYVDPGWEHCVAQDEKKKRVKCNYCEKIISGGINRFKQHLARIPGEVAYCDKAPEEVYLRIKDNMKWHRTGRRNRKLESKEMSTFYTNSDNEDEEEEHEGGLLQYSSKDLLVIDDKFSDNDIRNNIKGRSPGSSSNGAEPPMKRSRLDSVFLKSLKSQTSSHYRQTKAKMGFEKKARKEVISAICKFFYHAGLPSNAANSPYFHKMLELVGQYGPGLQGPSSRLISGRFLQDEITTIKEAKHAIKAIHGDDARKYGPFWSVIENQWSSSFHHPLYMAAYFLNPSYRYRPDFLLNPEVIRGLNECIVRLEADNGKRVSASMQIPDFVSARADFGTDLAISTRMELDPAAWWQQHGISCLELQRIAIRMLSQTCSSLVCEHTWSIYDQVHSKRHSSVSRKRWNELTYVHYNLRLRERQLGRKPSDVISFDNLITENILDDWLVESDKQPMQEDEEILYNEMDQFDGDEMDENDHQEKRPADMVTLAGVLEPLDVIPAAGGVTTDDDDLDFLDDDLTD